MDLWDKFDDLDRLRRAERQRHEEAFRRLDVRAERNAAMIAWERYCEAARSLDACVAEIESLVWKLNR